MNSAPLLSLAVVSVLGAITPVVVRRTGRAAAPIIVGGLLASTALLLYRLPTILDGGVVDYSVPWVPALGIDLSLRLDALSLVFALLILVVGMLVVVYGFGYFRDVVDRARVLALLVCFAASMLGLVLAHDAVVLVVFWEATSVLSYFLIGGNGTTAAGPARLAALTTGAGGFSLLAGLVLLQTTSGSWAVPDLVEAAGAGTTGATAAVGLILLGAFTKSAQWPFHYWLPGAMLAPTPVSAYLHSATMVKAGVYLLFRFSPAIVATPWLETVLVIGLVTALMGAAVALVKDDLKAILAYSTVSTLGLLTAMVGLGTRAAVVAAAVYLVAHAAYKSGLFMLVGAMQRGSGTRSLGDLAGLGRRAPGIVALVVVGALSMAAIPPTLAFLAKEVALDAALEAGAAVAMFATVSLVVLALLTVAYSLRVVRVLVGGPTTQVRVWGRPPVSMVAPAAITVVTAGALGLFLASIESLIELGVPEGLAGGEPHPPPWLGLPPALVLSVAAILLGVLVHVWQWGRPGPIRRTLPALADLAQDLHDRVIAGSAALVTKPTLRAHPGDFVVVGVAGLGACVLALAPLELPALVGHVRPELGVLALLMIGAMGFLIRTRQRVAGALLLGAAGLVVTALYGVLGAYDIAMTQVLVETLALIVAVFIFSRIRRPMVDTSRLRTASGAATAVVGAVIAGFATYSLVGSGGGSAVSEFYVDTVQHAGNVVSSIIIDFRALDTLGELTVIAMVALSVFDAVSDRQSDDSMRTLILLATARVLLPVMVIVSVVLFLRGHVAPGGGFIAGLVAGGAVVLKSLLVGPEWARRIVGPQLVGFGMLLAVSMALLPVPFGGVVLENLHLGIRPLGLELSTALVFDAAVYLVVIGLVLSLVDSLGFPKSRLSVSVRPGGAPR